MRQHIGDPAIGERIDQERFAAQRSNRVKSEPYFMQSPLNGGKLGNVAEMTGYAKVFGGCELRQRDQLREDFQRTSLMGHHLGIFFLPDWTATTLTVSAPILTPTKDITARFCGNRL